MTRQISSLLVFADLFCGRYVSIFIRFFFFLGGGIGGHIANCKNMCALLVQENIHVAACDDS